MKKLNLSKYNIYLITISILLSFSTLMLSLLITKYNILPSRFMFPIMAFIILIPLLMVFLMLKKKIKKKIKKIISIISIPIIIIYWILMIYISKTYKFIENIIDDGYIIENYSVIVLNNDKYNELSDLDSKKLGYFNNEETGIQEAISNIENQIQIEKNEYTDYDALTNDLYSEEIDSIIIEESYRQIIEENKQDFNEKTKTIYSIEIKRKKEDIVKNVDVKNETFNIYISGIDVYGNIQSVSRSDVNIVASINPQTHQMLLITIPRDYYVQLDGTTGNKDKLTHAGIYGIDKSVKTLENLLDIEINYYIKVNFSSVEKMIDVLGGVDVYSEYSFIGYENSTFKQGFNRVNGKQGLEFARTRKTVQGGDRTRGANQEALIQAILNKATSKEIITKYSSILNSLNGTFQTNMPMDKITDLIKEQINSMAKWTVTSIGLDGSDARKYTYSCPGQLLYVMVPNEQSIEEAKEKLKEISEGNILEGSYKDNISGNVNIPKTIAQAEPQQPVQIQQPPKEEPIEEPEKEEIIPETTTPEEPIEEPVEITTPEEIIPDEPIEEPVEIQEKSNENNEEEEKFEKSTQ